MLYDIGASFTYRYDSPANAGRHLLRLTPASVEGSQRVVASHLDIRPAVEEKLFHKDFFGNSAVQVVFRSMLDEIEFKLQCRVERLSREPAFGAPTMKPAGTASLTMSARATSASWTPRQPLRSG